MYQAFPTSAASILGLKQPVPGRSIVNINETNAGCAIKITGRAFVTASNDLYNGIQTTRWNRSRLIRGTNCTATTFDVSCQCIPGGISGVIAVVVDNVRVANISVTTTDANPRWYTVSGLAAGSKTVEIWEEFQGRETNLNSGIDGKVSATYVLAISMPNGYSANWATPTAPNGIVAFGDSHIDGDATAPDSYNGWCGQVRRAGHINGNWLVGYAGAGSSTLCGDGPTAAQTASMIHDLWVNMGSTAKKLLIMRRPNDQPDIYYGHTLTTSPTVYGQYIQDIQTALDSSDPGWTGIYTRIPQGSNWGANAGGFTLDDYWNSTVTASTAGGRTNATTFNHTAFTAAGLSLANPTHFFEAANGQVHLAQAGHDIVAGVVRGWYGL